MYTVKYLSCFKKENNLKSNVGEKKNCSLLCYKKVVQVSENISENCSFYKKES